MTANCRCETAVVGRWMIGHHGAEVVTTAQLIGDMDVKRMRCCHLSVREELLRIVAALPLLHLSVLSLSLSHSERMGMETYGSADHDTHAVPSPARANFELSRVITSRHGVHHTTPSIQLHTGYNETVMSPRGLFLLSVICSIQRSLSFFHRVRLLAHLPLHDFHSCHMLVGLLCIVTWLA